MSDGAPKGRRDIKDGPWAYCARCDKKKLIDVELQWQRGKLLCAECYDNRLIGDREVEIALVLSDGAEELAPDPKLREPDATTDADDVVIGI